MRSIGVIMNNKKKNSSNWIVGYFSFFSVFAYVFAYSFIRLAHSPFSTGLRSSVRKLKNRMMTAQCPIMNYTNSVYCLIVALMSIFIFVYSFECSVFWVNVSRFCLSLFLFFLIKFILCLDTVNLIVVLLHSPKIGVFQGSGPVLYYKQIEFRNFCTWENTKLVLFCFSFVLPQ